MFDWLTGGVGSLLGGGISALGSFFGGQSQAQAVQAANQANIQQAQYQETGAYLPQLVRNAQAAGLNPLAVLPGGGGSANIQPVTQVGSGIASAMGALGQSIQRIQGVNSPHEEKMAYLAERDLESRIANQEAVHAGQLIENARMLHAVGSPPPAKGPWPLDLADELDRRMSRQINAGPGQSSLDVLNDTVQGWGRAAHQFIYGQ